MSAVDNEQNFKKISTFARYTITAVVLFVVTFIEISVLYPPLMESSLWTKISLLVVLGILKFIVVVAIFMHLYNDPPIYSFLFGLGMLFGLGAVVALIVLIPRGEFKLEPMTKSEWKTYQMEREKKHQEEGDKHALALPVLPTCVG